MLISGPPTSSFYSFEACNNYNRFGTCFANSQIVRTHYTFITYSFHYTSGCSFELIVTYAPTFVYYFAALALKSLVIGGLRTYFTTNNDAPTTSVDLDWSSRLKADLEYVVVNNLFPKLLWSDKQQMKYFIENDSIIDVALENEEDNDDVGSVLKCHLQQQQGGQHDLSHLRRRRFHKWNNSLFDPSILLSDMKQACWT